MCGIAGFLSRSGQCDVDDPKEVVQGMALALHHRGPDDGGAWVDARAGIALGFRRLAILDTSERGHQPMLSADGRYVIVFNGEIYNFREIRGRLEGLGHVFSSGTDTEVILAAAVQWGASSVPEHLQGMFAYALWDRDERVLHLVRDRVGIKPLYYGWNGNTFLFGSELSALEQYPGFEGRVDPEAVELYLDFGYVPTPLSIYEGIRKLQPGTALQVQVGKESGEPQRYWELSSAFAASPWTGSDREAVETLENILESAVERHMVSDVPLGALLSGGIDSSTVVAMMCAKARGRVKTFSIGFAEKGFDESIFAREVAHHLGTDHTEMRVSPEDALAVIPKLPEIYDEPFADSSQIPTFLISQLARSQVTVALSGDGGDELFGGYNRYLYAPKIWRSVSAIPRAVRVPLSGVLKKSLEVMHGFGWEGVRSDGSMKAAMALQATSLTEMYWGLCRTSFQPAGRPHPLSDRTIGEQSPEAVESLIRLDMLSYLPDDILTKVDRASMAVSLEARIPLLDDNVIAFAARLPRAMKIRGKSTKWLLRQVLYKHVPRELMERPKAGFAIPLATWLRGSLADWADGLLDSDALREQNFLDPAAIHREWLDFRAGKRAIHYRIWALLMLQAWSKKERRSPVCPADLPA